jgi:putative nucleotidyltransferase with HDIG domain
MLGTNKALLWHGRRVAGLACVIAGEMGYCGEGLEYIGLAAFLHDIGKIELPEAILNKPASLDELETAAMRKHPQYGYRLLQNVRSGSVVADIVLQHHERMDGSGYPCGLQGMDIHPAARIIAVADVVEAMLTPQVYRPALSLGDAVREIRSNEGLLYDRQAVETCRYLIENKNPVFKTLIKNRS